MLGEQALLEPDACVTRLKHGLFGLNLGACRRLFNDQAQRNMEMMKGVEESMKSDSTEPLHVIHH